ncbi:Protein of unknown function [Bacillus cereus]|nr:Protein of unknown function [Bacillus cereus]
MHCFKLAD